MMPSAVESRVARSSDKGRAQLALGRRTGRDVVGGDDVAADASGRRPGSPTTARRGPNRCRRGAAGAPRPSPDGPPWRRARRAPWPRLSARWSSSHHDVGQGMAFDMFGVVPEHPGESGRGRTRSHPSADTSMVMAAALCTRERKRATSSRATSKRRRSVRSRMLNSTAPSANQLTGVPISSSSRQPPGVLARTSRVVPISLAWMETSERPTSSRSSGCTRSRAERPSVLLQREPEHRFGPGVAPQHLALRAEHDDDVGELVRGAGPAAPRSSSSGAPPSANEWTHSMPA